MVTAIQAPTQERRGILRKPAVHERGRDRLAARLRTSFDLIPVEDGFTHPAEDIIAEVLASANYRPVLRWLRGFCADSSQPSFAASVIRLLGRQPSVGTVAWRKSLLIDGLAADNVEVRDAAVQAAESWADPESVEILKSHDEPQLWLSQYIADVIEDLAG